MSIWACSTRSVVHTSSSPQSLKNEIWKGEKDSMLHGEQRKQMWCNKKASNPLSLTYFLTVVGQPSSNTGPLSVLLILNRSEKLIGRM